jgi:hypothetical protein
MRRYFVAIACFSAWGWTQEHYNRPPDAPQRTRDCLAVVEARLRVAREEDRSSVPRDRTALVAKRRDQRGLELQ